MNVVAERDSQAHRAKAKVVRKGHIVKDCTTGMVIFDGIQNAAEKLFPWSHKGFKGINAAKRFIRKNGTVSYTAS